ncbi:MAG: ABC transporter permease subunit, partial [Candidatus Dormibacteraceae bacterium]
IRAVGANRAAARLAGFDVRSVTVAVFVLGGGCGGLAGALLVLGEYHDVDATLSSNYGLMGVAIALIARLKPLWVVPISFLFGVVIVGGSSLSAVFGISNNAPLIIVSLFPILLMAFRLITLRYPEI